MDMMGILGNSKEGLNSEDGMTVFGFGRDDKTKPLLSGPQQFVIGFYPEKITNEVQHKSLSKYLKQKILKKL